MGRNLRNAGREDSPGCRLSRRDFLGRSANGFGAVALAALWAEEGASSPLDTLAARPGHYRAKAKSVIFLYMDGGVSQVDSFDPKPRLTKENGKPFAMTIQPTQFNNNGNTLGSPWKFAQHGQSGIPVSDLFPHVATCVDDLAIIRSMTAEFPEHTNANYYLHTGHGLQGRPSMGAWAAYGLGTENRDLPGFIVLNGGLIPPGGLDNFNSGFLPAAFQGSIFKPKGQPVANILPSEPATELQRNKLAFTRGLDGGLVDRLGPADAVESAIRNHELAFRMQMAVPELMEVAGESNATRSLYGLDDENEPTRIFGAECLLARRLVERGVRFVELTCPVCTNDRWDAHSGLVQNHGSNARAVDRPIAGLLTDLKSRGLLEETLVVWAGEFGRTPFAQGSDGRDHNPFGFTVWLAGGGVKGGVIHGATDEYGYHAIDGKVTIHDLHATMLHLLGVDHERLTYHYSGRDVRLTDVHGAVMTSILA